MSKGRPSIKIDHQRLRNLRKERGWTQYQLSAAIREHVNTWGGEGGDKATLIANYQRIEGKGKTSEKIAGALATIFGKSTAYIKGLEHPDSGDYLRHIESLIQQQLNKPDNLELQKEFDQIVGRIGDIKLATETLAREIGERIEAIQLVRDPHDIAELTALTGLSETELLSPANVLEHWFINVASSTINLSEILHGAGQVVWRIQENVKDLCGSDPFTDASIRMWRDGSRYRIEVTRPRGRNIRIVCMRFQPVSNGLSWIEPSWRDEYLIEEPLIQWAMYTFNFVCDFEKWEPPKNTEDTEELPNLYHFKHSAPEKQHPVNLKGLRFLVKEYSRMSQGNIREAGRMVISGNLAEIHDETLKSFQKEGSSHLLVQNWLTVDLKCALAPFFNDYPRECWSLSGLAINLNEGRAKERKRPLLEQFFGMKYSIQLVEQVGEQFEPVPWREKDRRSLQESLQKMLDDPNDSAWATEEPRRAFTPYTAEP